LSKELINSYIDVHCPGYKINHVAGDGLCIFHAFIEGIYNLRGFLISLDDVKMSLREQLVSFKAYYSAFSESNIDIVDELDRIFENPLENC